MRAINSQLKQRTPDGRVKTSGNSICQRRTPVFRSTCGLCPTTTPGSRSWLPNSAVSLKSNSRQYASGGRGVRRAAKQPTTVRPVERSNEDTSRRQGAYSEWSEPQYQKSREDYKNEEGHDKLTERVTMVVRAWTGCWQRLLRCSLRIREYELSSIPIPASPAVLWLRTSRQAFSLPELLQPQS